MITNNFFINTNNNTKNNKINFKSDKAVYVCSKLATGYTKTKKFPTIRSFIEYNMGRAITHAKQIAKKGDYPYWNHSTWPHFVDDTKPKERKLAIKGCLDLVSRCEALVYFDKPRGGMKQEISKAKDLGMVVMSAKEYRTTKPKDFDKMVEESPHYKKLHNIIA